MKYVSVQHDGMEHFIPFSQVVGKYNVLFLTKTKEGVLLAKTLREAGGNVKVHYLDNTVIDKSFDLVGNWESWKNWADLIVYDSDLVQKEFNIKKKLGFFSVDLNTILKNNFSTAEKIYRFVEALK